MLCLRACPSDSIVFGSVIYCHSDNHKRQPQNRSDQTKTSTCFTHKSGCCVGSSGRGTGETFMFRGQPGRPVASLSATPSAGTSGRCGSAPWGHGLQQLSPRASASPFRPRHPTCHGHGKSEGTSDPRGRRTLSTGVQRVGIGLAPGPLDTPVSPSAHRQRHSRAQYQNVPTQK